MSQWLWWLLLPCSIVASHMTQPLPAAAMSSIASSPATVLPPHCLRNCGSVEIPYPFGIGDDCYWPGMDAGFNLTCNNSFNPPRLYVFDTIEIINISTDASEMQIFSIPAYTCYNSENTTEPNGLPLSWLNTTGTPFLISPTRNLFTAIGCYAISLMIGKEDMSYLTGCITTCESTEEAANDYEPCTGLGCCQTAIHANLSYVEIYWGNDTNPAWRYSPCNYGFVAERNWYNFRRQDLDGQGEDRFDKRYGERGIPMVLDWAIRNNGSCKLGMSGKPTAPACVSPHSYCENALQGDGYICKCLEGYKGNPYDPSGGGCANIDECKLGESNSTTYGHCGPFSTCKDTDGDYICKCKINHKGLGKSQKGCDQYVVSPYVIAAIAIVVAIILACFLVILLQRRNQRKLFNKNGGVLLKAHDITIYSETDLKNITKGSKRLGGGQFGEVYEGKIDGTPEQRVAVKYSKVASVARHWPKTNQQVVLPQEQEDDNSFVNEIIFQFRIKHTNVVKLIGCCLETDVPILVFEFISNGSLYDKLHGGDKQCTLSLMKRLDIAIGSAEALSHIHSHGDHVHCDVKPSNILLDDDLNPKVSDFGSSKLLSLHSYFKGIVSADMSYIDPVYLKTQCFDVKSDVYSFGVVLLELITKKTATYDGNRSLPIDFVKCFKDEGSGRKMYDREVFSGDHAQSPCIMQSLDRISMLAVRCLKEDMEDRPTMAEVVDELKLVKELASGGLSSSEAS